MTIADAAGESPSGESPLTPVRPYADPPPLSVDAHASHALGRQRRRDVGFDDLLAGVGDAVGASAVAAALVSTPRSGLDVMLVGSGGLDAIVPVVSGGATLLDVAMVDDALPGPFEIDIAVLGGDLARCASRKRRHDVAAAFVKGYRRAVHALAETPAHAIGDRARMESVAALDDARRRLSTPAAWTYSGAVDRLCATRDGHPRLRRSRVRALTGQEVDAPADDPARELAQVRETLPDPEAAWLASYRVADALDLAGGDRIVLLAGATHDDRVILAGAASHPSTLEPALGAWRQGSDLQRVLLARSIAPIAPAGASGWSTSPDGAIARAWARLRTPATPGRTFMPRDRDLEHWARACGITVGLVHGHTGDVHALAGYLGRSGKAERALAAALADTAAGLGE